MRRHFISQGQLFSIDNLDLTGSVKEDQPRAFQAQAAPVAPPKSDLVNRLMEERRVSGPATPKNPISNLLADVQAKLEHQLEE